MLFVHTISPPFIPQLLFDILSQYSFICINLNIGKYTLSNSRRRNKGNFTSKSNSNKIKLGGGGGQQYLVLNKIPTL